MDISLRCLEQVEYEDGLKMQQHLQAARGRDEVPDLLLVLYHPHVFTLGRRATLDDVLLAPEELKRYHVTVARADRGGEVTYHGPGQWVLYPILALPPSEQSVSRYVHRLEEVMLRVMRDYGLEGERVPGLAGAWIRGRKIGAVGVHMSHWVTSHGLAFNVSSDLSYFRRIVPCGIRDRGVTSLTQELGHPLSLEGVRDQLVRHFGEVFEARLVPQPIEMGTIQAVIYQEGPPRKILLIRRNQALGGFWQPVTGRREAGESPAQAAVREVREETGLVGDLLDLEYVHSLLLEPSMSVARGWSPYTFIQEHAFALKVDNDASVQLDATTHNAFRWVSPAEAGDLMIYAGNRRALERLMERLMERSA